MNEQFSDVPDIQPHSSYIKEKELGMKKYLVIISTMAICVIAGVVGYSFYYNHNQSNEWTLFPKPNCSPNLTCQAPVIPKSPDCVCGACNCPKIDCGNYTLTPNITLNPNITIYNNRS